MWLYLVVVPTLGLDENLGVGSAPEKTCDHVKSRSEGNAPHRPNYVPPPPLDTEVPVRQLPPYFVGPHRRLDGERVRG